MGISGGITGHILSELPEEIAPAAVPAGSTVDTLEWSADGHILLVYSSSAGGVTAVLGNLPAVGAACGNRMVQLTSLREAAVFEVTSQGVPVPIARCALPVEPEAAALGDSHIAVSSGSRAWFLPYNATSNGGDVSGAATGITERDYISHVEQLAVGSGYAAALAGGRITLHVLSTVADGSDAPHVQLTSDACGGGSGTITCCAIAGSFLYFGTSTGHVSLYNMEDGCAVVTSGEYRHSQPIASVHPSPHGGTRAVFIDAAGMAALFNPIDGSALPIHPAPARPNRVIWDLADPSVFAVCNDQEAASFVCTQNHISGPSVQPLGTVTIHDNGDVVSVPAATPLAVQLGPAEQVRPLVLINGSTISAVGGPLPKLEATTLTSHSALPSLTTPEPPSPEDLCSAFAQLLALHRLPEAAHIASALNDRSCWLALGGKAMEQLDVPTATQAYRHIGDAAMTSSLEALSACEDVDAVAGHMAALFGDYDLAEARFLRSGRPALALLMRRALGHWQAALVLAEAGFDPEAVPSLALQIARQLEASGNITSAVAGYDACVTRIQGLPAPSEADQALLRQAQAGLARCSLRCGDVDRGMQLLALVDDPPLVAECASLLQSMGHLHAAAELYIKSQAWDSAVGLLLDVGNLAAAGGVIDHVQEAGILLRFARAAEAAKDYSSAADAFERSGDATSLVRLLCDHVSDLDRAAAIVRSTKLPEAARLLAAAYVRQQDTRSAVEFLLFAGARDDAFTAAAQSNQMGVYVSALSASLGLTGQPPHTIPKGGSRDSKGEGPEGTLADATVSLPADECARICRYYESRGDFSQAAEVYAASGQLARALQLYLQSGTPPDFNRAIDVAVKAKDAALTQSLVDHLQQLPPPGVIRVGTPEGSGISTTTSSPGRTSTTPSGTAASENLLFKLYLALGDVTSAGKTAVSAANAQQEAGNYKLAHSLLFTAARDIVTCSPSKGGATLPVDVHKSLALLHSYLLVKRLVRAEDHSGAARLMVRVAQCINRFPAHAAAILTSTVIECHRAGMKRTAYEYACQLMSSPALSEKVDDKFRRKIEDIVRRPSGDEAQEPVSLCPFCNTGVPVYDLSCATCQRVLPFCIVTGQHMTTAGCSACPRCTFPALHAPFASLLSPGVTSYGSSDSAPPSGCCPMCGHSVQPQAVMLVRDPAAFLRKWSPS